MAKAQDIHDFMAALNHPRKAEIEVIQSLILAVSPAISQGVNWNAPSFFCEDWFATFHLRTTEGVEMILHRGARVREAMAPVDDPAGLLRWLDSNRASVIFADMAAIEARREAFTALIRAWIAQM